MEPRIIITGRDLLIQAYERDFDQEGQILEMLPYRLPFDNDTGIEYQLEKTLQQVSQLEQWWATYLQLKHSSRPIPEFLNHETFKELVDQPLLNFLLALTYLRGEADFGEDANVNNVYYDLMARVLNRPWGKHTHLKWTIEEFLEVMEEVATSAWHTRGDVRITSMAQVRKHCQRNEKVHARILALEENPDAGYMRLMAAFYFRQEGNDVVDKTFEFTHKSFGEYLVARRIVTLVKRICKGLATPEFYGFEQAKQDWLVICGEEELTAYIWPFLKRQVALVYQDKIEEAREIQTVLSSLFSNFITHGFMPIGAKTNLDIFRLSRNAESTLLLAISAYARVSGEKTAIRWRDAGHPRHVLSRLMLGEAGLFTQGLYGVLFPLNVHFGGMKLSEANLSGADLREADLSGADLSGADLSGADLSGADLSGANLIDAILIGTNLIDANLIDASLGIADLMGANLMGADLRRADLTSVRLMGANLMGANLMEANLIQAGLMGVNLIQASLIGANLSDADLSDADLREADLSGADLRRTNLRRADLREADLRGADLMEVNLITANLSEAVLYSARIEVARKQLNDQEAYDYFKSRGAINVPEPPIKP